MGTNRVEKQERSMDLPQGTHRNLVQAETKSRKTTIIGVGLLIAAYFMIASGTDFEDSHLGLGVAILGTIILGYNYFIISNLVETRYVLQFVCDSVEQAHLLAFNIGCFEEGDECNIQPARFIDQRYSFYVYGTLSELRDLAHKLNLERAGIGFDITQLTS